MSDFIKPLYILATLASLANGISPTMAAAQDHNTVIRDHREKVTKVIVKKRPDLNRYCQVHHGVDARLTKFSALNWVCYRSHAQHWGISVKQACKEQYGLTVAKYDNKADPYSWYCTKPKPTPNRPGVDLTRHCKIHHGTHAFAKLVGTKTALDWVCTQGKNDRWGIRVSQACKEQHNLPKASYSDRKNPYTWFCHK